MGAVLRDTTIYTSAFVNKYVQDARDVGGRAVPLPFELTVISGATDGDTYNLTVIPANAKVVGLECTTDGLGDSAGAGVNFTIGDSGDPNRYMAATDFDVLDAQGDLAFAGQGYKPTADAIVVGLISGAAGVVGQQVKGVIWIVPGA